MAIALCALLGALTARIGTAQDFKIMSTQPAEDAVDVALTTEIIFEFSDELPAVGSAFSKKFTWSPEAHARLLGYGQDPHEENDLTKAFFRLEHDPNTDVAFFVYGVRDHDGRPMARPFALNYTTAESAGEHEVAGSTYFSERSLPSTSSAISSAIHQALQRVRAARLSVKSSSELAAIELGHAEERSAESAANAGTQVDGRSDVAAIERTVVLLMRRYRLDKNAWQFNYASTVSSDGAFSIDQVRSGTYWPVAIHFADSDGEAIGAYGFYDPDGDFEPDPVVIEDGNIDGIELPLYTYGAATAGENLPLARALAARAAEDQRLMDVRVLRGPQLGVAFEDGTAMMWRYRFVSPSTSTTTYVALDAINAYLDTDDADEDVSKTPLPVDFIDSDEAVRIADENGGATFRADHANQDVRLFLWAGDLPLAFRPAGADPFWLVEYSITDGGASPDNLSIFVDAVTGEILEGTTVSTEHGMLLPTEIVLQPNYPNPFRETTTIQYDLPRAAHARVSIYNLLGQRVAVLVDALQAAGNHEVIWRASPYPSGVYVCRVEALGTSDVRFIVHE